MSRDAAELLDFVGDGFRIEETDHFDIAYDTSYEIIRPLVGRLEGTYDAIGRFCKYHGVGKPRNHTGLRVIIYDQYEDYKNLAKKVGVQTESVAGFFSHDTNIAIFCNSLHSPPLRAVTNEMKRLQDLLKHQGTNGSELSKNEADVILASLGSLRAQRDIFVTRFNRLVIQHEAAHQVFFNIGVHVKDADTPNWLIEGLACQFEVSQTDPRGLLRSVNHMRLADFRDALGVDLSTESITRDQITAALESPKWVRLEDFLIAPGPEMAVDGAMAYYYGQSWALVYFLHRTQRDGFSRYLKILEKRKPMKAVENHQKVKEFQTCFGDDLDQIERDWIKFALKLRLDRARAGR